VAGEVSDLAPALRDYAADIASSGRAGIFFRFCVTGALMLRPVLSVRDPPGSEMIPLLKD
jgi:hypothetical protein